MSIGSVTASSANRPETTAAASELVSDQTHLIHSLHSRTAQQNAHIWVRGEGVLLYDQTGKAYIDALAGLWNVVAGHGRTELAEAAARQMSQLAYATCYTGSSNRPAIQLGERLAEICYPSIQRFFFTSGGAESNESAFKTARFYWKMAGKPDKVKIVGRQWGYHGTTLAAMSATGIASYWPMFEPRVPGFLHIASPYPYRFQPGSFVVPPSGGSAWQATANPLPPEGGTTNNGRTPGQIAADLLEEAILREGADTVAAFIGEPVQGAGGVIVPPDDYWPRIRAICERHQVLLIADEVITGFGRMGDWFGLSRYGIEPDIVTFAKGITSGYFPLGGIGVNRQISQAIDAAADQQTWMHAFTYSAHPVGCAVALANLDIIEREGLRDRARQMGQRLLSGMKTLESHPHVGEVRGLGLACGVELVADKSSKAEFPPQEKVGPRVHAATRERGMFTRLRGDVYLMAPAFVIQERQVDQMVQILGDSIAAVLGPSR